MYVLKEGVENLGQKHENIDIENKETALLSILSFLPQPLAFLFSPCEGDLFTSTGVDWIPIDRTVPSFPSPGDIPLFLDAGSGEVSHRDVPASFWEGALGDCVLDAPSAIGEADEHQPV